MLPERMKQLKQVYKETVIKQDEFARLEALKTIRNEYGILAVIAVIAKEIREESN